MYLLVSINPLLVHGGENRCSCTAANHEIAIADSSDVPEVLGGTFTKFALERTAVDAETPSGLGDISFAIGEYAMDMFPFGLSEGGDRDCGFVFINLNLRASFLEGVEDIVGIGGFGEKVGRAQANGIDGCGDASEA